MYDVVGAFACLAAAALLVWKFGDGWARRLMGVVLVVVGVLVSATIVYGSSQGPTPKTVALSVPCQRVNQLNCAWYGQRYGVGTSETPPLYSQLVYYSWVSSDGRSFCRYYVGAPFRGLVCARHWPLTRSDVAKAAP